MSSSMPSRFAAAVALVGYNSLTTKAAAPASDGEASNLGSGDSLPYFSGD